MPLSTDRLPNLPLNGPELKRYIVQLLVDELEQRSVPDFAVIQMSAALQTAMDNDFMFKIGTAYPQVGFELSVRLHWSGEQCAFSIEPKFAVNNPLAPKHEVYVRCGVEPPLLNVEGTQAVEAFTMSGTVTNPNLVRIHYRLPIELVSKVHPKPGQLFGEFETEVLEYDPSTVPMSDPPKITDYSEEFEAAWGIHEREVMPTETYTTDGHDSTVVAEVGTPSPSQESAPTSPKPKRKSRKGWQK
jgi:hypothetical protein